MKLLESLDFRPQGIKVFRKIVEEISKKGAFTIEDMESFSYFY